MERKRQNQLRNSVVLNTVGNVVYYLSQQVLLILVMRLSGSYASGLLSTAMSIAAVCIGFSAYGMRSFQISDFERKYTDRTYLRSRWLTVGAAGIGCAAFAMAVSYTAEQRAIILLYTVCRLSEALVDVWHGYLQRAERMDIVGISFGVRGVLTMVCFGAGLWATKSLIVTVGLLTAVNWAYIFVADIPLSVGKADLKAAGGGTVWMLLWECAPLAVYSFLNSSIGSVVKLYCERIAGTAEFGNFNNVFGPVQLLQTGAAYIFVPFMTLFAHRWADGDKKGYLRAFFAACAAMPVLWVCGAAGVALVGKWGLNFLYGADILPYAGLLQPMVVTTVINAFVMILCYLLSMMREMKGLIVSNAAGIAAAFFLSGTMISRWGVYGAAYSTTAARAVQAVCALGFLLWRYKKHFASKA